MPSDPTPFLADVEEGLNMAGVFRQQAMKSLDHAKRRWALWTCITSLSGMVVMLIGVMLVDKWELVVGPDLGSITDNNRWARALLIHQWVLTGDFVVVVVCLIGYYYAVLHEKRFEWARSGAQGGVRIWRTSLPYFLLFEIACHALQPWPYMEPNLYIFKLAQLVMMIRVYTVVRPLYNYSETSSSKYTLTYADGRRRAKVKWTTVLKVQFYQHTSIYMSVATASIIIMGGLAACIAENHSQPKTFGDAFISMWWTWITFTTVGYGDITPITPLGRVVGGVVTALGLVVVALAGGVLTNKLALTADQRIITSQLAQRNLSADLREAAANIIQLTWRINRIQRGYTMMDGLVKSMTRENMHLRRYKLVKKHAQLRRDLEEAAREQFDTDRKVEELISVVVQQSVAIQRLNDQMERLLNVISPNHAAKEPSSPRAAFHLPPALTSFAGPAAPPSQAPPSQPKAQVGAVYTIPVYPATGAYVPDPDEAPGLTYTSSFRNRPPRPSCVGVSAVQE